MTDLPAPLAAISADLAERRATLMEALRALTADDTPRSPGDGEWCAAQVVDHLLLAEGFTNDLTKMMCERARAAGEATGFPADLTAFAELPPPISLDAPPPIPPQKELPPRELIAELEAMAERTTESFRSLASIDPTRYKAPHPLFGELDLGQWWAVHPLHYEMHIAQAQAALKGAPA